MSWEQICLQNEEQFACEKGDYVTVKWFVVVQSVRGTGTCYRGARRILKSGIVFSINDLFKTSVSAKFSLKSR